MPQIVVLTGAGISAESGVPTFRDADGLWEGHHVDDVATPEGFDRDRGTVQRFYDERRAALRQVEPNAAHRALAELEETVGDALLVITQNIDDLHERAGSRNVVHMHGELLKARCRACGSVHVWQDTLYDEPDCPGCGVADLRPDVVWFGEVPYEMDRISAALAEASHFVSIGTSGAVYPAAGFVQHARRHGAHTLELNLERSEGSHFFHEARQGRAGELVPAWAREILWA
ncbi:NAD-dependent protein deacylase [Nocardioides sp. zg-536]|uniref:NAD-dependent protein deacylase n=1 Tax=Nocardioides faecalis TaxID=2803858 RepID=A0A938Y7I0_9ACTN|nr:Sir2 family NAD+-dependent deacetylase [Nocardioides faecalis]MBM9458644.1 NAD-dependent protein deacylase [Nocardioides faecalis]MBS4752976.1 NAD-dependent protein deacylase [Nocardioides faecalis]QVI58639.1 NAD-dependent protein deacylase [Nocardioides faecalis]